MTMLKLPFKFLVVTALLAMLAACGVGEFFIKRAVNNLEENIADELKSYARFTDAQEQTIEEFSRGTARWIRTVRLPILIQQLETLAQDIEADGLLAEASWRSFVLFMEDPIEFTEAPGLLDDLAILAHGLSEQQQAQVMKKLAKKHDERMQERSELTAEDQVDKIVKGVKTVFNEIGIERSRAQLKTARQMLAQRRPYLEMENRLAQTNYGRLVNLLETRDSAFTNYRSEFSARWREADKSPIEMAPQDWEHNLRVSHNMMNYLLQGLSAEERLTAAQNIRRYAALFADLTVMQKVRN